VDNATLAKLGRVLYRHSTVVKVQARELQRLEWENARLRAERDDAEAMLSKWAQRAIDSARANG